MTELVSRKRYRLRITAPYAFLDTERSHLWREWPEGAIVTDPAEIELLIARGAPVERIDAVSPASGR
jgi:hypothetical protein